MNTNDLRSLQALRQLREQRASSQLAAQQQRCRETHSALDDAKEKLRLHREALARKAEQIYGNFSEGLSVSAWQAAQDHLDELADNQRALETSVDLNEQALAAQERERDVFRTARMARQRQAEACDSLLDHRLRSELQARERRDESDDLPVACARSGA
jgi:hypothetical protein